MTVEPNFAKCSSVRDTLDKLLMRFFFLGFRKKEPITLTRSQPEVDGDDDGDDDDDVEQERRHRLHLDVIFNPAKKKRIRTLKERKSF